MNDLKPAPSPSVLGKHLFVRDGALLGDPFVYHSTIGALQYLTHIRPDIAYIVSHLRQFLQKPTDIHWQVVTTDIHWQVVKRVLRYISGTKHFELLFQLGGSLSASAFYDANWASSIDD